MSATPESQRTFDIVLNALAVYTRAIPESERIAIATSVAMKLHDKEGKYGS